MPRALRAVVLAGAAVGLLLLAVWQVPQWLDWTRYRATVEVLAAAVLGQPVSIRGPISLSLLPQPVLTAAQVSVGASGPTDLSVQVAALRLGIELWPLLSGRVDARELVLHGLDVHIPWVALHGISRPHPPAWLAAFAVRVEDGRLTIGRLVVTGIDARLETLDTGALLTSGQALFGGQPWHFTARLTAAGPDGVAGVNATLDGQGQAAGLGASFSGQLAGDGTLAGSISGRGSDPAALMSVSSVPFRIAGRLIVGSGLAAIEDLALRIGASSATGAVALRIDPDPRLDVAVSAGRLDLDALLPVLLRTDTTIAGFDLPIRIDLSVVSAPLAGGTLEHLKAGLELDNREVMLREASVLLPGNAALHLSGRIELGEPLSHRFDGDARLDAPTLYKTLQWLAEVFPGIQPLKIAATAPENAAQQATLTAHVAAGAGEITMRHLTGRLDGGAVSGALGLKWEEPRRLSVDLSVDRLLVDRWLPRSVPRLDRMADAAPRIDVELRLSAREAIWGDEPIRSLTLDADVGAGRISLRRIEGTVRQGRVIAAAQIDHEGQVSDGKLAVTIADAASLVELVPPGWRPNPALWHGPGELTAHFAGPPQALAVTARLELADARMDTSAVFDLQANTWEGSVSLHHPAARRFVAALVDSRGPESLPGWIGDGSLSLKAQFAGKQDRFAARDFDLTVANLHTHGDLLFDAREAVPLVSGAIIIDDLAMPLPSRVSGMPLPFDYLRGWRGDLRIALGRLRLGTAAALHEISARMSVTDGALRIEPISAGLGSGTARAVLTCDATAKPATITLQIKLADVDLTAAGDRDAPDTLSGRADADIELAASGFSPSALLATLHGRLAIGVTNGTVWGFDLSRLKRAVEDQDARTVESAAGDALMSGATGFDELRLLTSIAHGEVTIDEAKLIGASGEAQAAGSMQLADGMLDVRIEMQPGVLHAPELAVHLSGPIMHPNRTPELTALARWRADLAR